MNPTDIHIRPWPHPIEGPSIQYEVGGRGVGTPVTVLASPPKKGGYVSWRSGSHRSLEDAEAMALSLLAAVSHIRMEHP